MKSCAAAYGVLEAEDDLEVVAILDVRLPDGDGVEVCRELRSKHPEIAGLMLTSFADDEALFSAVVTDAAGYVLKQGMSRRTEAAAYVARRSERRQHNDPHA